MTDPITTIELEAVEPNTCQYRHCERDPDAMYAVARNGTPTLAGYCIQHSLGFADESADHRKIGTPKTADEMTVESVTHE